MADVRQTFQFDVAGALTTSSVDRWVAPFAGEIVGVTLSVGTAPTGAALICNLQKNGSNMFTTSGNRPTVAISATKSAALSAAPDVATFVAGDEIKLTVAQVGSTVAGSDLNVVVEYVAS